MRSYAPVNWTMKRFSKIFTAVDEDSCNFHLQKHYSFFGNADAYLNLNQTLKTSYNIVSYQLFAGLLLKAVKETGIVTAFTRMCFVACNLCPKFLKKFISSSLGFSVETDQKNCEHAFSKEPNRRKTNLHHLFEEKQSLNSLLTTKYVKKFLARSKSRDNLRVPKSD